MVRNPFLKEDKGCSFMCLLSLFAIVQAVYYVFYVDPAFNRDYKMVLIEMAEEMGYTYDASIQNFRPLLDGKSPFLQQDNFLKNQDILWVPALLFYFFSLLWLCSYFRLICTDIEYNRRPKYPDKLSEKAKSSLCRKCGVIARDDILHCHECGCCVEYHDHHCDVVQVCVCGANYKYFILIMFHAGNIFLTVVVSVLVLDG